jgi:hypothetical protein
MMSLIATFWNMFVSMKAQKKYFYYRKKMAVNTHPFIPGPPRQHPQASGHWALGTAGQKNPDS